PEPLERLGGGVTPPQPKPSRRAGSRPDCTAFGTTKGRPIMRVIERERKIAIINGLCNGLSLRAASRLFNTHRTAIQGLLVRVGIRCEELMAENMKGIDSQNLELDELWTFCGKKQARLRGREAFDEDLGDQFLFFAIDHDTKV